MIGEVPRLPQEYSNVLVFGDLLFCLWKLLTLWFLVPALGQRNMKEEGGFRFSNQELELDFYILP
jgi:hypothetical protein